jgi:putative transposase
VSEKRQWIEPGHPTLSVRRQCALLELSRSSLYYEPCGESPENLALMRKIDEMALEWPFYGSRRVTEELVRQGEVVNRKRVQRLRQVMGLEAIYPKPKTSMASTEHRIYPYLLRGVAIERPDQVWSTDITYIPMQRGFLYLVAVMDWFSRFVLAWRLSNTLSITPCIATLNDALQHGQPEVFNTDQGAQFTALAFTSILAQRGILISMDGRGRALDNVWIERLWRSVKYEDIYIRDYVDGKDTFEGLSRYFHFYNFNRVHQGIGYKTPAQLYPNAHLFSASHSRPQTSLA